MTAKHVLIVMALAACASAPAFSRSAAQGHYEEKPTVWAKIKQPVANPTPEAVGGYANGCQLGAQVLPEHGEGYRDIRRSRGRFYAQPQTIEMVQYIGRHLAAKYDEEILIGDLSQPAGGLMSYAHASHQNGLDVDVYFATTPKNTQHSALYESPRNETFYELGDRAAGVVYPGRFKPIFRDALYLAAIHPNTARIFINPVIKLHLCRTEADTSWLEKLRPWNGHNAHFHLRLKCSGSLCSNQDPVPPGDGCDADLEKWVADQSEAFRNPKAPKKPAKPRKKKPLPEICRNILSQHGEQ